MNLQHTRGYSAQNAANRTIRFERGLFGYPDNLRTVRDDPASELNYDQWFAALAAAGVNLVRVRLTGKQEDWGDGRLAYSIEPPPAGTFNVWHSVLDAGDLAQYHADQVIAPIAPELWKISNLGQLIDAAEKYGVQLFITPFDNTEFRKLGAWRYHAWNANNLYLNGEPCEKADRGYVEFGRQVFTDAQCIEAAKRRIQFILDAVGDRGAIGLWKVCEETTWLAVDHEFWGLDTWDERMHENIGLLCDWTEELAQYIKARSDAPVASGRAFANVERGFETEWAQQVNRMHQVPSIDIVTTNWYGLSPAVARGWLRTCQEYFTGKQIIIGQYAPYALGEREPYDEPAPYEPSKFLEWIAACGAPGCVGPTRWPGLKEKTLRNWVLGGYADPGMAEIAGVTRQLSEAVALDSWGSGACWDAQIAAEGLEWCASWGDGRHVVMALAGSGADVTVSGLDDGRYELRKLDSLTGEPVASVYIDADRGRVTFSASAVFVGYLRLAAGPPTNETPCPTLAEIEDVLRRVLAEDVPGLARAATREELDRTVLALAGDETRQDPPIEQESLP